MFYRVESGKYEVEIIYLVWDFSKYLDPGDAIVITPTVTIEVFSGSTTPTQLNLMLWGLPNIIGGTAVEQQIRLGIPGTIYNITVSVTTTNGFTYEESGYFAILPLPPYQVYLDQTTQLYPYIISSDIIQGTQLPVDGRLIQMPLDWIQGTQNLLRGDLFGAAVSYTIPPDWIQGTQLLLSGTIVVIPIVSYTIPADWIQGTQQLNSGTLQSFALPYTIPAEYIQGTQLLLSGTLI